MTKVDMNKLDRSKYYNSYRVENVWVVDGIARTPQREVNVNLRRALHKCTFNIYIQIIKKIKKLF